MSLKDIFPELLLPDEIEHGEELEVKKAAHLSNENGKRVLLALLDDDTLIVVAGGKNGAVISETKGSEELFYIAEAFYAGQGLKLQPESEL